MKFLNLIFGQRSARKKALLCLIAVSALNVAHASTLVATATGTPGALVVNPLSGGGDVFVVDGGALNRYDPTGVKTTLFATTSICCVSNGCFIW